MPTAWQRIASNFSTTATSLPSGTETVVQTLSVTDVTPDSPIRIWCYGIVSTGVGVTGGTIRIRRGGLTGTLVGAAYAKVWAASSGQDYFNVGEDSPGDVASQVYSVTVSSTAGTSTMAVAYVFAVVG